MFEFYYQTGSSRRKLHKAQGDYCTVGSARDNDFVVNHRAVSKRHAELRVVDGSVYIYDSGSASGTWVNRERVRELGPLTELDEILIGETHFWIRRVVVALGTPTVESGLSQRFNATEKDMLVSNKTRDVNLNEYSHHGSYWILKCLFLLH